MNFVQMGLARLFVGVGEACLTRAAVSMLSDLFPPTRRGTAVGLYYLGVPLGAGAGFLVAALLGPTLGWRNCFYVLGAVGLVLAPLVFILSDPKRGQFDTPSAQSEEEVDLASKGLVKSIIQVLRVAKKSKAMGWAMIGAVFMHLMVGSAKHVMNWLTRERGFELTEILTIYGLAFLIFGVIGSLLRGIASD